MGQLQSNLSQIDNDLTKTEDIIFEKKIILLILIPIYIIGNDELEKNLSTGNDDLDLIVNQKLNKCCQYITDIIQKNIKFNVIVSEIQNDKFYLTIEKTPGEIFSSPDCVTIRNFFDQYNHNSNSLTIITQSEASDSLFFDDLDDIKLGFVVESIDYM